MNKMLKKHNKKIIALLTVMILMLGFTAVAYANGDGAGKLYDDVKKNSIADQIRKGGNVNEKEILDKFDRQVSNVVTTVRVIAAISAVIFVIWLGIIFITSGGNPQRLAQAKTQVVMFFISMICIFLAEPIVRFVLSWFIGGESGN